MAGLTRPGGPETAASLPGPFPENSRGRRLWGRRGTQTREQQASSRALKADGDVGGDSLRPGAEAPQHDGVPAAARTSGARLASVPLRLRAGSARLCPESRRAPCRSRALDGAVWASGAGARPRPAVSCTRTRGGLGGDSEAPPNVPSVPALTDRPPRRTSPSPRGAHGPRLAEGHDPRARDIAGKGSLLLVTSQSEPAAAAGDSGLSVKETTCERRRLRM